MLTRSTMLRLCTSSSLACLSGSIVIPTKVAVLIFYIPLLRIAFSPSTIGAVGPKGAAMKNANITPVIDQEGIIGFIVEFRFDHFEAYFIDNLLGSFSSKAEAAKELLVHTEHTGVEH